MSNAFLSLFLRILLLLFSLCVLHSNARYLVFMVFKTFIKILFYYSFKGAVYLRVEFDRQCSTERRHDPLTILDGSGKIVAIKSGTFYCFYTKF